MNIAQEVIEMIEADDFSSEEIAELHRAVLKARGLPYAGKDDEYGTVVTSIERGRMDDGLVIIMDACRTRRQVKGQIDIPDIPPQFMIGQTVEVVGKLKPNYLLGHRFKVNKVNPKTCKVWVPNDPTYRRYRGQNVGIPKTALKIVAA